MSTLDKTQKVIAIIRDVVIILAVLVYLFVGLASYGDVQDLYDEIQQGSQTAQS